MANFGARLRQLRNDAGLSQEELGRQIGVSKSSVNMYERGEREPGFETIEAIADLFNVDMDYLLGRTERKSQFADGEDENLRILSRNAKKLSPEDRARLLEMARLLFKEGFDS